MKHINWNEVEAARPGEFNKLPAGGYICQITAVDDEPKKEYLKLEFDIADDERVLKGKYIGLVLGYEEYVGNDNKVKTRIIVTDFKSAKQIKDGDFEIPPLKELSDNNYDKVHDYSTSNSADTVEDDYLPF